MQNPIIDSIATIVNGAISDAPFDSTKSAGVIQKNEDGTYKVRMDGNIYNFPIYGDEVVETGEVVKVVVPNNNMNKAWIMPPIRKAPDPTPEIPISVTTNRVQIGDVLILAGTQRITTSSGTSPNFYGSEIITFPEEFELNPIMITGFQNGVAQMGATGYYGVSTTGCTLYAKGTTSREFIVRWIAIGKKKG